MGASKGIYQNTYRSSTGTYKAQRGIGRLLKNPSLSISPVLLSLRIFVEIEGDSPGEEAAETSNQFKESKKNPAPRGHMNDDTGTLGAASSTATVDK